MKKLIYIFILLACFASCKEDPILVGGESEIEVGEEVLFTTSVPRTVAVTRALNTELLSGYKTIADDYEVEITMLEGDADTVGSPALYIPESTTKGSVVTYDIDGTLKLKTGEIPETWNILHPEVIRQIHKEYLQAGCNIIKANTFGVNPPINL